MGCALSCNQCHCRLFAGWRFKHRYEEDYDDEEYHSHSDTKKVIVVEDEEEEDAVEFDFVPKRFKYYGYKGDHFYEEEEEEDDDPIFVPFKAGGYYYDGENYYECIEDDYGVYFVVGYVRYYIVIDKYPEYYKVYEEEEEEEDDYPLFYYFLKKGHFIQRFYDAYHGKKF